MLENITKDLDSDNANPEARAITHSVISELNGAQSTMIGILNRADEAFSDSVDELKLIDAVLGEILDQVKLHMARIIEK